MESTQSLSSFNSFVDQLKPEVGSNGGRYFRAAKGQVHSLNEIVREFRKQAEGLGDDEVLLAKRIISKIEDLDVQANTLLKEKNIIIRVATYIKRFFGNLFYDRGAAWKEVKALFPSKRVVTKKVLSLPPEKIDSHMNRDYVFEQMCFGFPEMRSFYENLDQKRSKEKITISPFEATPSDFKVISRMGILTREELRDFILHSLSVLRDPVRFFEQLKPVENLITKKLKERGISFGPESEPEYLIKGRGYFISGPRPQGCTPKQKGKVIDEVLLEIEQQLGLNTEGTPVFVGGVTSFVADSFVSMGHIFKEDTQISTLLLHGKNSHRLGFLGLYYSLQKTKFAYLKPKELFEILIHDKEDRIVGKETIQYSLWNQLIDNNGDMLDQVVRPDDTRSEWFKKLMNSEAYHYSCRSPFMLNSLLLCFGKELGLPNLSYCMLDSHWKATDKMVSHFQGKKPEMAYLLAMESLNLNSYGPGEIGKSYFFTKSEEEASLDEKYMCYPGEERMAPNVKKKPKIKQSDDEIKKEKLRLMRDRKYFVALAKKRDPLCLEYFKQQSDNDYYTHLLSRLECKNKDDLKFLSEMHAMAMQKFLTPVERDYLNSVKLEIKR